MGALENNSKKVDRNVLLSGRSMLYVSFVFDIGRDGRRVVGQSLFTERSLIAQKKNHFEWFRVSRRVPNLCPEARISAWYYYYVLSVI